jgi:hypothetical protein
MDKIDLIGIIHCGATPSGITPHEKHRRKKPGFSLR